MPGFATDFTNVPSIEHVQVGPAAEQVSCIDVSRPFDVRRTSPPQEHGTLCPVQPGLLKHVKPLPS